MTLHLVLKHKWFEMIAAGVKTEEYREMTDYWKKRIFDKWTEIDYVVFHRGYTNVTLKCFLQFVTIGLGKKSMGAEDGKVYYVLHIVKCEY